MSYMRTMQYRRETPSSEYTVRLALRSALGGTLMGLANLVPGISGGTMLLAAGIYPRFIQAIADITTFRFRRPSLVVLGAVVLAAALAILVLAGPVKHLVVHDRWAMYSLFIGLTLGGIPVVYRLARPLNGSAYGAAAGGIAMMLTLAWAQASGTGGTTPSDGFGWMFLAGVAGASAMILPGISGGYLLLLLGVYVPLLGAIDAVKNGLRTADPSALVEPLASVVIPVGLGVVIGAIVVSNLLKLLLARFEKPTLGTLLGLLAGAVAGLWPFQRGIRPAVGDVVKGRVMTAERLAALAPEKYPTTYFDPSADQIAASIGLVLAGFVVTSLVARMGQGRVCRSESSP